MIKKSFVVVLISGLLMSCSGVLYTSIDVLRPAKIAFPVEVNQLLIVNNTYPQAHDVGHITNLLDEHSKKVRVDTDSLPIFTLASFAESMLEKEFFSIIDLDLNSLKEHPDSRIVMPPSEMKVKALADAYKVNGIVSLNGLSVDDVVTEFYDREYNAFIAYHEARYAYKWSIHFPEKSRSYSLETNDTVYWESESYSRQRALNGLPDRRDALIDGALITGERAVNEFVPYWEKVDRYLFDLKDKAFKAGMDGVYRKKWDQAVQAWEALFNSTNNKLRKGKIAHNLAVVYEIKGELKQAYEYSNKALTNFSDASLIGYKSFVFVLEQHTNLQKRVSELELLQKQLGES